MTWYAIRTVPGSQTPRREFVAEATTLDKDGNPRGKGYRIVPSLDPNRSAIEKALEEAGINFYMPCEKRLIRDRLRPYLYKTRRFALTVGYIFIRLPHGLTDEEFHRVKDVPGVVGVVGRNGAPMEIDFLDMLKVFDAERKYEAEFVENSRKARSNLRKLAKKDPAIQKIVDQLDITGTISVPLDNSAIAA